MSAIGMFFGKLFGSDKALEALVKSTASGLDKLIYTEEERSEDAAKDRSEARQMIIKWMSATQGQNLSRRIISLSITSVWLLQYIVSQIVTVFAIFVTDPQRLHEVSEVMREGASDMGPAVMLILAFYFSAPFMGDIAKASLAKFNQRNTK